MKKTILFLLLSFSSNALFALPAFNPANNSLSTGILFNPGFFETTHPGFEALSLRGGFYGDYVFNRHLKTKKENVLGHLEKFSSFTNSGYAALNFYDRFELFATLGVSRFYFETFYRIPPDPIFAFGRLFMETESNLSWSLGFNALLWQYGNTFVGVQGQYFQAHPFIDHFTFEQNVINNKSTYPTRLGFRYKEWQVNLVVGEQIGFLVPYIALGWSDVQTTTFSNSSMIMIGSTAIPIPVVVNVIVPTLENQRNLGMSLGCSFFLNGISLSLEGSFISEKALSIIAETRF